MTTTGIKQPIQAHNDRPGQMAALRMKVSQTLEDAGVYRNCLTCEHFVEHMERCDVFGQRPPAKIIAYGCEKHSDEIPF